MKANIAIIGAGNMGAAFYRGLITRFLAESLAICDPHEEKLANLHGAQTTTDANDILPEATVVLFAVKPQVFEECTQNITVDLSDKLMVSIMAGVPISRIMDKTGSKRVVRAMPNLPAQVGKGMTGWLASPKTTTEEKDLVRTMFESVGDAVELESEEMINAITAISGSGPAYFLFICEILLKKAKDFGFSPEDARVIMRETFYGTAKLLEMGAKSPAGWREAVTSKGGTTEAAFDHLYENNVDKIFMEAVEKARKRSDELSQE